MNRTRLSTGGIDSVVDSRKFELWLDCSIKPSPGTLFDESLGVRTVIHVGMNSGAGTTLGGPEFSPGLSIAPQFDLHLFRPDRVLAG